jgi:hypothetical protein
VSNDNAVQELSLAASNVLFGPPPVLSSENATHYNQMWHQFTALFKPNDIAELMMIRNLVDANWEAQRYVRHRTLSVERRYRQSDEYRQKRAEEIKKRHDAEIERLAQKIGVPASEFLKKCQLDSELEAIKIDMDEIFERIPSEIEHARALESAIDYHLQIETLLNGAMRRRDSAIALLDLYCAGLGHRLREEAEKIIDATATVVEKPNLQIEAPSIVPNEGEGST